MKKLIAIAILLLASTINGQQPVVVPIQNPSFDSYVGWKFGPGSRIESGRAIAGYGSWLSQDLGVSPAHLQALANHNYHAEGVYALKFSVANYFPNYPGYYEAKISFGTQELCETTGWGTRNFTQVTLVCPSPGYLIVDKALPGGGPVQGQQNLAITFSAQGWTLLFDDVSLEFTPQ